MYQERNYSTSLFVNSAGRLAGEQTGRESGRVLVQSGTAYTFLPSPEDSAECAAQALIIYEAQFHRCFPWFPSEIPPSGHRRVNLCYLWGNSLCVAVPVGHSGLRRSSPHSQSDPPPARRGTPQPCRSARPPRSRRPSEYRGSAGGSRRPRKRRAPHPPGLRNRKAHGRTRLQTDKEKTTRTGRKAISVTQRD